MRKLVIILIAFIAVVTFIRAFDNTGNLGMNVSPDISEEISEFD
jgi:hypothetical protein